MASSLVSRSPQCLSCVRRMATFGESIQFPAGQQIRGKKKVAKATTIKVKLLRNIAGFGKKGSIVPIPPGTMRNTWFPNKMAEYMTWTQVKELGDVVVERDTAFGGRQEKELMRERKEAEKDRARKVQETTSTMFDFATPFEPAAAVEQAPPIESAAPSEPPAPIGLEVMRPAQAAAILGKLLPTTIEFYRTPAPVALVRKLSPSLATHSNRSVASTENAKRTPQKSTKVRIIGSVSTADITAKLKAILSEDREGARVALSPEDIAFEEETEDKDRVTHLGIHGIYITLGPGEIVRTTIEIKPQN